MYVCMYSDTSANEDNSFQNHICQPKSSLAETHIQTEKISYWNGPTFHVCCFMLARASTKTFVSRIHIRQLSPKNSEKNRRQPKNSLAESLVSRGITVYMCVCICVYIYIYIRRQLMSNYCFFQQHFTFSVCDVALIIRRP